MQHFSNKRGISEDKKRNIWINWTLFNTATAAYQNQLIGSQFKTFLHAQGRWDKHKAICVTFIQTASPFCSKCVAMISSLLKIPRGSIWMGEISKWRRLLQSFLRICLISTTSSIGTGSFRCIAMLWSTTQATIIDWTVSKIQAHVEN